MSLQIPPGRYGIDKMHTQLGFAVKHLGISTIRGTFDRYDGALTVGGSLAETSLMVDAEMASINSGNPARDEYLNGPEFFDVASYPQMRFMSTAIVEADAGYLVTGDLTIKGVTLSTTMPASFNGSAVSPIDQLTHYGFSARCTISRSAYGVSYGASMVSDEVDLELNIQFLESAAG